MKKIRHGGEKKCDLAIKNLLVLNILFEQREGCGNFGKKAENSSEVICKNNVGNRMRIYWMLEKSRDKQTQKNKKYWKHKQKTKAREKWKWLFAKGKYLLSTDIKVKCSNLYMLLSVHKILMFYNYIILTYIHRSIIH